MRRRFVTVLAVLFLVSAGTAAYAWFGTSEPLPAYRLAKAERGPLVSAITATGKMSAVVTVEVSSQLSGQLAELNADFNSKVANGQILARLNTAQLVARLKSAQADLDAAGATLSVQRAQRDKAQADIANARAVVASAAAQVARAELAVLDADRDLVRREELRSRGVATTADFEKAQTAARSARAALTAVVAQRQQAEAGVLAAEASFAVAAAQVQVAEANVAQRQAALQLVQVDIDRSEIRSPIDGVVVDRKVNVGQTVAASLSAPTLFTIAQDLRHMQVLANIDEADIGRVREGLPVTFTLNTFAGETFHGTVSQVRLAPAEEQNVVSYIVAITVENHDMRLLPGLTANLRIVVDERRNAVKVPNAALRFRPADAGTSRTAETAPAPTLGGPSGGRGAAALEELGRRLANELGLDGNQRAALDAVIAEARSRFGALSGQGDPEQRRTEARAIRQRADEQIAGLLTPDQREKFESIRGGKGREATARTVWVVGAAGTPVAVPVRIGISDGSFTEVIGGIEPGQEIITGVLPPEQNARKGPRLAF